MPYFPAGVPEYTKELSSDYLAGILTPLQQQEQVDEATAKSEGAAGGLIGKFTQAGKIQAARSNLGAAKASAVGNFELQAANAALGQRQTDEARQFQDTERQRTEDFQKQMQALGFQFEDAQRQNSERSNFILGQRGFAQGGFIPAAVKAYAASQGGGG